MFLRYTECKALNSVVPKHLQSQQVQFILDSACCKLHQMNEQAREHIVDKQENGDMNGNFSW